MKKTFDILCLLLSCTAAGLVGYYCIKVLSGTVFFKYGPVADIEMIVNAYALLVLGLVSAFIIPFTRVRRALIAALFSLVAVVALIHSNAVSKDPRSAMEYFQDEWNRTQCGWVVAGWCIWAPGSGVLIRKCTVAPEGHCQD
jgi:hypothetical protein